MWYKTNIEHEGLMSSLSMKCEMDGGNASTLEIAFSPAQGAEVSIEPNGKWGNIYKIKITGSCEINDFLDGLDKLSKEIKTKDLRIELERARKWLKQYQERYGYMTDSDFEDWIQK